jgi:hypothetical protein
VRARTKPRGWDEPGLAGLQATFDVVIARRALVATTPARPGEDPVYGRRRGPDEPCKEMAHFWDGQGKHSRSSRKRRWSKGRWRETLCCTNPCQEGQSQQHKRDVSVPANEAADLIVIQSEVFGVFKSLFNGLITNDKFCMSRTARLQLSHWRLPRSARQSSSEKVQSPVEENVREYLPQQETYEKTTMESSSQLPGTA